MSDILSKQIEKVQEDEERKIEHLEKVAEEVNLRLFSVRLRLPPPPARGGAPRTPNERTGQSGRCTGWYS